MDENVVITLSSSDEESGQVNQSKPKSNVSVTVKPSCSRENVIRNTHNSDVNKLNDKSRCNTNTRTFTFMRMNKNCLKSRQNPEVVDLVDCLEKSSEGTEESCKEGNEPIENVNNSTEEIVEIYTNTPNTKVKQTPDEEQKKDEVVQNTPESVVNTSDKNSKDETKKGERVEGLEEGLDFVTEFVNYCGSFEEIPTDRAKLTKKLMKRFQETDPDYLRSQEFRTLISEYRGKIRKNNLYIIAKNVTDELGARKKFNFDTVKLSCPVERKQNDSVDETSNNNDKDDGNVEENKKNRKLMKLIKKITKRLNKLGRKIQSLEEAEVDFSDEENSTYVQLQRYRERYCRIYKALCKYREENADANRVFNRRICFTGSKYPAINSCIENWLNKTKRFPDFTDIMKLLESQSSSLGLPSNRDSIRAIAVEIFQQVGVMLQRRRKYDLWDSFCGFLDSGEDPAKNNPELEKVLTENFETRVKKEEEILKYYAEMQEKEKLEPEEVADEVANLSPAESATEYDGEMETEENEREDVVENDGHSIRNGVDNSLEDEGKKEKPQTAMRETKNNHKNCKSLTCRSENVGKVTVESSSLNGEPESSVTNATASSERLEDAKENNSGVQCEGEGSQKKRGTETELSPAKKRWRSNATWKENIYDVDTEKENRKDVFDIHYCHIEHNLEKLNCFIRPREKRKHRGNGKVFRDLTNVGRLIKLHGSKKKMSRVFSPLFFRRSLREFEKPSWKKKIKLNYKLLTSKCALNQEEKSGKSLNGDGGESENREVQSNSEGEGGEDSNYLSGQGNGNEGDNDENDENKKNGNEEEDSEENKIEEEKEEEIENEESENKVMEHSREEELQKTEKHLEKIEDTNSGESETVENPVIEDVKEDGNETEEIGNNEENAPEMVTQRIIAGTDEKTDNENTAEEEGEERASFSEEKKPFKDNRCESPPRIIYNSPIEPPKRKIRRRNTMSTPDEERVKQFLLNSPSSISITPPKKLSLTRSPSQAALQALATLRGLKDISATRVRGTPKSEDEVVVIGGSAESQPRNDLPVISSVQSIDSTTPKIVTVQGNVSGFENPWSEDHDRNSCSLKISNVWGNLPSNFIQSMQNNESLTPGCSFRQSNPGSSSGRRKSAKKTVEYVVLE